MPAHREVRYLLLGPVIVTAGDEPMRTLRPRARGVLAFLVLSAGHSVSLDALTNALWGGTPPSTARSQLHQDISAIRRMLRDAGRDDAITTSPAGYCLKVDPAMIDVEEFADRVALAKAAIRAGDTTEAVAHLHTAMALWRGEALADVAGSYVDAARAGMNERRLAAYELLAELELGRGNHREVVVMLTELVRAHPLRERLHGHFMLALHRCGRQAEALQVYRVLTRRLADEHGLDPSPDLQRLHGTILTDTPDLVRPPQPTVPNQLPMGVPDFVGRAGEEAEIRAALHRSPTTAPAIVVISGMGGIGKTTLAVRAARRALAAYPDGVLYADLRGTKEFPADPVSVLGAFLRALDVAPAKIPLGAEECVGLFRSVTAGRRLILVLDDAAQEDQVRPLLPAEPGCAVIITSRPPLAGLDAARHLRLGPMQERDGVALLDAIASNARTTVDSDQLARLAELCGGLPLALRITGLRLALRPDLAPGSLADQLGEESRRLDGLHIGDRSVRASLALSYRRLPASAAALLSCLSTFPGADIAVPAAAALAGITVAQADRDLELLETAGLAHSRFDHGEPRYFLHDLTRLFAAEQEPAGTAFDDGVRRVVGWYTTTALSAAHMVTGRSWPAAQPEPPVTAGRRFATHAEAVAWFNRECANAQALLHVVSARGWNAETWRLAYSLDALYRRAHRIDGWLDNNQLGIAAARAVGHREAEIKLRNMLAGTYFLLDRLDEAAGQYHTVHRLCQESADAVERARSEDNLGLIYWQRGDPARAEEYHLRALNTPDYVADPSSAAAVHIHLGIARADLGRHDQAADSFAQAIVYASKAANWFLACHAHHNAAELALMRHRLDEAEAHAQAEIAVAREMNLVLRQARGLHMLGDCLADTDPVRARQAWASAIEIYDQLGNPFADDLRPRMV